MHRTCAEYRNENQTRIARCGAALNVSPQQPASAAESRVFHVPQKIKISSRIAFKNCEVVYGPNFVYAKFQDDRLMNELSQAL